MRNGKPRGEGVTQFQERLFSLGSALYGFLGVGPSSHLPGATSDKALGSGKEIADAKPWRRETVAVVPRTEASVVKR